MSTTTSFTTPDTANVISPVTATTIRQSRNVKHQFTHHSDNRSGASHSEVLHSYSTHDKAPDGKINHDQCLPVTHPSVVVSSPHQSPKCGAWRVESIDQRCWADRTTPIAEGKMEGFVSHDSLEYENRDPSVGAVIEELLHHAMPTTAACRLQCWWPVKSQLPEILS